MEVLIQTYVVWNLMRKTELLETWVEDFNNTIQTIDNELKEIDNKIKLKVNEAADFAIESELPDEAELFKDIIIE